VFVKQDYQMYIQYEGNINNLVPNQELCC